MNDYERVDVMFYVQDNLVFEVGSETKLKRGNILLVSSFLTDIVRIGNVELSYSGLIVGWKEA